MLVDRDAPFFGRDLVVVDAGVAAAHESVVVELPVLVAVASPPLSFAVAGLVLEADRDATPREAPEFLLQLVVQLTVPLAAEEVDDGVPTFEELVAVSPLRVDGVGERDPFGVAGV